MHYKQIQKQEMSSNKYGSTHAYKNIKKVGTINLLNQLTEEQLLNMQQQRDKTQYVSILNCLFEQPNITCATIGNLPIYYFDASIYAQLTDQIDRLSNLTILSSSQSGMKDRNLRIQRQLSIKVSSEDCAPSNNLISNNIHSYGTNLDNPYYPSLSSLGFSQIIASLNSQGGTCIASCTNYAACQDNLLENISSVASFVTLTDSYAPAIIEVPSQAANPIPQPIKQEDLLTMEEEMAKYNAQIARRLRQAQEINQQYLVINCQLREQKAQLFANYQRISSERERFFSQQVESQGSSDSEDKPVCPQKPSRPSSAS